MSDDQQAFADEMAEKGEVSAVNTVGEIVVVAFNTSLNDGRTFDTSLGYGYTVAFQMELENGCIIVYAPLEWFA